MSHIPATTSTAADQHQITAMLRTAPSDVTGQSAPESANDQSAAMAHTTQPNPPSSAPSPSRDDQPFRFLDLPPELRLMVYKEIDPHTRHYRLKDPAFQPNSDDIPPSYITLVTKSLPVALLATCRLINAEAAPILAPKLKKLRKEAPHFIVDSASFGNLIEDKHSIGELIWDCEGNPSLAQTRSINRQVIKLRLVNGHDNVIYKSSAKYDAIQSFVRKFVKYRASRPTEETVFTIRAHPLVKRLSPGNSLPLCWTAMMGMDDVDSVSFEMYGFEDEEFGEACASVKRARARGDVDQLFRIGAVGEAEWKGVWEDVVDVVEFEWEDEEEEEEEEEEESSGDGAH
jgi:hypothetical protein